ncbi:MAG: flagellar protein FlaG [Candidatus Magnetoovum sp. WYHC-5]|nr:flagellar protein FlaG [Candidatus Magnetoovum sp. WYHC-5]
MNELAVGSYEVAFKPVNLGRFSNVDLKAEKVEGKYSVPANSVTSAFSVDAGLYEVAGIGSGNTNVEDAFGKKDDSSAEDKDTQEGKEIELPQKAYFDVDENNNVVIKIVSNDGEVIKQIPPEDYIKMVEGMKESVKNLFHLEV